MTVKKKRPSSQATLANSIELVRFDRSWCLWTKKDGLRCIHIPLPKGDHRIHISLLIHTGSRFEAVHTSGISHFLEHMMFRGSAQFPSFSLLSEAFENLGGEWNAATGHEYTEFFYSGTTDKTEAAFDLFADFFLTPKLQDLEVERRIIMRELEGELNENGDSTDTDFHILKTVWPKTSMAMPIVGTEASLLTITEKSLRERINQYYHPKNIVLSVVGGARSTAKKLTKKYFSNFPKERVFTKLGIAPLPTFVGPKCVFVDNADNEYEVQISFVCEGTNSEWTPAYDMLSRILGDGFSSRLVKRIREELGLVYDISTTFHQYYGQGLFSINSSVSESNIETFFDELFTLLDKIITDGPSEIELGRHRTRALTDLKLLPSDPCSVAFRLGWSILTGSDLRLEYWREKFERVSNLDIKACARTLFDPKNRAVGVLGPKQKGVEERFIRCTENNS